jgi:hypothetical protein
MVGIRTLLINRAHPTILWGPTIIKGLLFYYSPGPWRIVGAIGALPVRAQAIYIPPNSSPLHAPAGNIHTHMQGPLPREP